MEPVTLTLTMLVGLVQIAPNTCEFELLHPNGQIDTHQVDCKLIYREDLLQIKS